MSVPKLRFKTDDGSEFPAWKEVKIADIADCVAGATPSTKIAGYWEDGTISWMSSGEVNNRIITKTEKKITQLGYDKTSTTLVPPDTIVIALAGQGKTRGMVAITRIELCTNQSLAALVAKKEYNADYLYQYLLTRYDDLRKISSGDGTRGGLNLKLVGDYKVKVPSLAEQQKIAACLSTVDQIIEQTQTKVELWGKYKRGVMQLLFGRKRRFKADDGSEFPEWEEKKIQDVCTVTNGKGNTQDKHDDGEYAFFVRSDKVEHSDNYLYDKEAVITIGDGNIGKVFHYFKGKFNLHQRCYAMFDFKNVSGKYFYYYFSAHFLQRVQRLSAKGTVDSVRMNFITDMKIIIPCLAEQQKIAGCLSAFDDVIDKTKKELDAYRELKKGLLQQMFV